MLTPDVLKKIKHIEIHTRRLLKGSLVGDKRSALKGTGFEFDQIREYQLGDDTRYIDWNSSSRFNKLLVKQYTEERSRSIILAADVSRSGFFSSSETLRSEIIMQIVGVLSLVATNAQDRLAVILFSDEVELYIPLNKGKHHARTIMEHVFSFKPKHSKTMLNAGLEHIASLNTKDAQIFLISDFIDDGFEKKLKFVAKKSDLIAIRCLDVFEHQLPECGFITVQDSETGEMSMLDLRNSSSAAKRFLDSRLQEQNVLFKKLGIDCIDIALNKPFIADLVRFFRQRMMY